MSSTHIFVFLGFLFFIFGQLLGFMYKRYFSGIAKEDLVPKKPVKFSPNFQYYVVTKRDTRAQTKYLFSSNKQTKSSARKRDAAVILFYCLGFLY